MECIIKEEKMNVVKVTINRREKEICLHTAN